jgi:hypothetical protein
MTTAPMNPLAGPAGPGKYATRTDNLQMGSIAYGEGVETEAIKSGAPLAKTGDVKGMQMSRYAQQHNLQNYLQCLMKYALSLLV